MNESALAAQQQEFDALTNQMAEVNTGLLSAPEEHRHIHARVWQNSYDKAVEYLVNNPELVRHYQELGELVTTTTVEQIAIEETSLEQLTGYVKEGLLQPEDVALAAGQLALKKAALEAGDDFTLFESLFGNISVEEDTTLAPKTDTDASSDVEADKTDTEPIPPAIDTDQPPTPPASTEEAPKPRRRRSDSSKELSASAAEEFDTPGWRHFSLDDARRLGIVDRETGQVLLSKLTEIERSVVKYSLLNETGFRMERLRKDVSEFIGLSPKEWDAFKNHFRDTTQKAIEEALQKAGITAKWHEVGQRRGQRYRLSIEEKLEDKAPTPPATATSSQPPATTETPSGQDTPTSPVASAPSAGNTEDSPREQYLARQAAEKLFIKQCTFAEELTAGIKEMLNKSAEGIVKRSLIIIKVHREFGSEVERDDIEIAVDNLLEADMLPKGRPEGGSRTISLYPDRTEKNGNKKGKENGECKKPGALTETEQALVPAVLDHLVSLKPEQGDLVKGIHAIVSLTHKGIEAETISSIVRKLERAGTVRTDSKRKGGRAYKGMLVIMDDVDRRNEWRNSPKQVIEDINAQLQESVRK